MYPGSFLSIIGTIFSKTPWDLRTIGDSRIVTGTCLLISAHKVSNDDESWLYNISVLYENEILYRNHFMSDWAKNISQDTPV